MLLYSEESSYHVHPVDMPVYVLHGPLWIVRQV